MRPGLTRPMAAGGPARAGLVAATIVATFAGGSAADMLPAARLRNWDVDTGLPSPRAFAVATTPDGYVWIGTYAGLCRFDGLAFTILTPREAAAIGDPLVTALAVDPDGALWGGTQEGHLFKRTETGFEAVAVPEAAGLGIRAIRFDHRGTLWLATEGGVVRVRGESARFFGPEDGLTRSAADELVLDADHRPWTLAGGRVHRLAEERWQTVPLPAGSAGGLTAIAASREGGIWCAERAARLPAGRASRVFRLTGDGGAEPPEIGPWPINPDRSRVDALGEDEHGRLWCCTRGGGLHCREPDGRWWTVGKGTSLARADGIAVTAADAGSTWIGTRSNGVYQVDLGPVRPLQLPSALADHVVTTVAATSDGTIWAGTDGGGVACWQGDRTRTFGGNDGLPSPRINALAVAGSGRLYAATMAGLAVFDGDRFVDVEVRQRGGPVSCDCLLPDGPDTLWVGTREATVRIDAGGLTELLRADGERLPAICLTRDETGQLFALSRDGTIYRHVVPPAAAGSAAGAFEELLVEASEPFGGGRVIAADEAGGLWVGSYGSGLARIADGRLRRWSHQADGLPSSHTLALVPTAGAVWVAAENGIYGCPIEDFARDDDGRQAAVWRITQAEGLPEKVCTAGGQPAACRGPDGRVWMGNGRSVAGFRPEDAMVPIPVFPPQLEGILADGVELPFSPATPPVIPPGVRRLEFRISSPNTAAPQRLLFRHRLVGFDDSWVELRGRRVVSYTGLPPGTYRFLVEVRGPNSDWQSLSQPPTLRIPPRFWQRREVQAAALGGLVCLVAGAVWAVERRRSQRRLDRLRIEQAREQERQRIARDIHDDIGSGLTEIVMLSHLSGRGGGEAAGETIQRIEGRARSLTRAMDEVVWAINPKNDSLEGFITYFHRWAQAFLSNAGLRVRWDLPLDSTEAPLPAEVRHGLLLACKEAVTNVVKHAAAKEVSIRCSLRRRGLEIVIEDDGSGFLAPDPAAGGHGLGNLRTRLAELGGRCDIDSAIGRGTRVRFEVTTTVPEKTGNLS